MRKKEPSRQKKETHSLSAVTGKVTTLKFFLLLVGGPTRPSLGGAQDNFSPVAAISVNIESKIVSNRPIELQNTPKASNTLLTPLNTKSGHIYPRMTNTF